MSSVGDKEVVSLGDALEDRLLYGRGGDALDLAMMIDSLIKTRIAEALQLASAPETGVRCTCKDYPGADQFCTVHKVRPAHTAAHDCACAECVKAETRACPRCGYQTPILNGVCNICAERPTQL